MTPFGRTFKPMLANNSIYAAVNPLIWADAVYVRDFMAFMDLPAEALLKLTRDPARERRILRFGRARARSQ
jgi:hypothetical protein